MTLHFIGGVLTYAIAVSICYLPAVKSSPYYFPIGLACGVVANALWLDIARKVGSNDRILLHGFYWDAMIIMMYALVPVVITDVRLSSTSILGLLLIVTGIVLTKL